MWEDGLHLLDGGLTKLGNNFINAINYDLYWLSLEDWGNFFEHGEILVNPQIFGSIKNSKIINEREVDENPISSHDYVSSNFEELKSSALISKKSIVCSPILMNDCIIKPIFHLNPNSNCFNKRFSGKFNNNKITLHELKKKNVSKSVVVAHINTNNRGNMDAYKGKEIKVGTMMSAIGNSIENYNITNFMSFIIILCSFIMNEIFKYTNLSRLGGEIDINTRGDICILRETRIKNKDRILIATLNINSLSAKFEQMKVIIGNDLDIIVI